MNGKINEHIHSDCKKFTKKDKNHKIQKIIKFKKNCNVFSYISKTNIK